MFIKTDLLNKFTLPTMGPFTLTRMEEILYHGLVPPTYRKPVANYVWNTLVDMKMKTLKAQVKWSHRGLRIPYLELGDRNKPTLVFLHGFADRKENFLLTAGHLKNHFHLIIPDLPGHGQSERRPQETYSLTQFTEWLKEFLISLEVDDLHLSGNSLGGCLAAHLALRHPQLIKSLTLINAAGVITEQTLPIYNEIIAADGPFLIRNRQDLMRLFDRIFHSRPYIPLMLLDFIAENFAENTHWYDKIISDLTLNRRAATLNYNQEIADIILNDKLQNIRTPTLIIWGEKDRLIPLEAGEYLWRNIPNAQLQVFPNMGHGPQLEGPREFGRVIKRFIHHLPL